MSGIASAHGSSTASVFGVSVSFPVVLGMSATIGSLGGPVTQVAQPKVVKANLRDSRIIGTIGVALIALAVLLVFPTLYTQPSSSTAGILIGGLFALIISVSINDRPVVVEANTAFGVLTIHHALEGVALATSFAAGEKFGLATAVVLTSHTIVETAVVGSLYTAAGRGRRGLLAISAMQMGYVGAALGSTIVTISVTSIENIVPAIASGVLLCIGIRQALTIVPWIPDIH